MPVTHYFWDPLDDNVVEEYDENGNTLVRYATEPGLHGELISQERDGVASYHHFDGQGSTLALTNEAGEVTDTYAYNAFGETTEQIGTTENSRRYIGEKGYEQDSETATYYVRARSYEPAVARWLSTEPFGIVGELLNVYTYVHNRPLYFFDPLGLFPIELKFAAYIPARLGMSVANSPIGPFAPGPTTTTPGWLVEPGPLNVAWLYGYVTMFETDNRSVPGYSVSNPTSRLQSITRLDTDDIMDIETMGRLTTTLSSPSTRIRVTWPASGPRYISGTLQRMASTPSQDEEYKHHLEQNSVLPPRAEIHVLAAGAYPFVSAAPTIDYNVLWEVGMIGCDTAVVRLRTGRKTTSAFLIYQYPCGVSV